MLYQVILCLCLSSIIHGEVVTMRYGDLESDINTPKIILFAGDDADSFEALTTLEALSQEKEFTDYQFTLIVISKEQEDVAEQFPADRLPVTFVFTPDQSPYRLIELTKEDIIEFQTLASVKVSEGTIIQYTTEQDLYDLAQTNQVFIKIYEEWCSHCKELKKHYDIVAELSLSNSKLKFVEIKCSESGDKLCSKFGVTGFPTLLLLDQGGNRFTTYQGKRKYPDLTEFLEQGSYNFDQTVTLERPPREPFWFEVKIISRYWTIGTIVAYLVGYTAYDKAAKTILLTNLWDVLFFRKGADHSLVQWNKVISLVALTNLGMAVTPGFDYFVDSTGDLITTSTLFIMLHFVYSLIKYYNTPNIPVISSFPSIATNLASSKKKTQLIGKRKISAISASIASSLTYLWLFDYLSITSASVILTLVSALSHFYYMEIDFKDVLHVRPFGYLAFLTPTIAIVALVVYFFI